MEGQAAVEYALSLAREHHERDADALLDRSDSLTIRVLNGKVEKVDQSTALGLGVRVVKEEAVGMYEVAVLEAGSAKALNKWMTDHGYKYPNGMDKACEDYVKIGWCFVAVKSKVSSKKAVSPKPGMRAVKTGLPVGASFDGHVQAMTGKREYWQGHSP